MSRLLRREIGGLLAMPGDLSAFTGRTAGRIPSLLRPILSRNCARVAGLPGAFATRQRRRASPSIRMRPMRDPYRPLAPRYDRMADDPGIRAIYRDFRRALITAAAAHRLRPRVIVDLACGTGNTAIPWARARGRTVVGVDVSEAMLRVARKKSRRVRWVKQDLTRLSLDVTADIATCHFDALNHILDPKNLQRVFMNTARLLRPGGLFLFDLTTRSWLEWLSTSEKLFKAGPDVFMATNALDRKTGLATFNQLWFVKQGNLYRKVLVTVQERSFEDAEVRRMLRAAGLHLETIRIMQRMKGRPVRKLYVAVKRGRGGRVPGPVSGRFAPGRFRRSG